MSQVINNENDYRLNKNKASNSDQGGWNSEAGVVNENTAAGQQNLGAEKIDNRYFEEGHEPPGEGANGTTRRYLGDVSNQIALNSSKPTIAPSSTIRRRPLGGDNGPLQQHQKKHIVKTAGAVSTNGGFLASSNLLQKAPLPQVNVDLVAYGSNSENRDSDSAYPNSKTSSALGLQVPARLPQKRQATESSTNLVEKLHTITSTNATSYKKSRLTDYQWQDLDEEDLDDPLMVSEYVNDIFPYLYQLEQKMLPDPQYLFKQKHLKPKMRSILVDWLVEMHLRFRLLPETLFLAINIMDRFMSLEVVQIDKLQLLATSSLFIAAKYEEVFSPSVKNYSYFTEGSYSEEEILQAEKYILTTLNFDLSYPNPMNFLRRISKADDYDVQSRTLGKYLLEITIIDHKFIGFLPSLCSASAMYIARLILGGYKVEDMKECIQMITQYLVAPVEHEEFFKKYATRKFMKASIVCRSWAKKVISENKDIFAKELSTNTPPV